MDELDFNQAELPDLRLSKEQVAALGYSDPVFFCRFFLPHYFKDPMPWVHRGMLAILCRQTDFLKKYGELDKIFTNFVWKKEPTDPESPSLPIFEWEDDRIVMNLGRYNLFMLPRGFSKTTLAGVAVTLRDILYQEFDFIAYVSETLGHAAMQAGNIKNELEGNERIRGVFGNLVPDRVQPEKWSANFFETTTGVAVVTRGRGGQIRGLMHKSKRPQKILVDDVEDEESVKTPEQRMKTRLWAYGTLMPALPELDPNARIDALGTLLHSESLLQVWSQDPIWTTVKFGSRDLQGDYLWPQNLDERKLKQKHLSASRAGTLQTFYMEYFNQVVAAELQKFRQENIIIEPPPPGGIVATAIYCDPAISEKRTADRSAIYVVGMAKNGLIWVLDCWTKRGANEREKVDAYFSLHERWAPQKAGVEATAYQAALIFLMKEEMFRRRPPRYFEIEAVKYRTRKAERILGILQPRYASGYIRHARRFPELEEELMAFGMPGVHDDQPDALAGAVQLLDPWAATAAGLEDLSADSMPDLDDVIGADWRSY